MIIQSMKSNNGGDIHMRAGIMASKSQHQAPGVLICPTHKKLLQKSLVAVHGENKHEFFSASEENCIVGSSSDLYSADTIEKLFTLSKDIEYLLNKSIERKDLEWFRQYYISKLIEKDLATPKGSVRQRDLIDGFKSFYGLEFLNLVQSDLSYEEENNWLSSLLRKPKKSTHPVRHLLRMRYIGISLEELFKHKYEHKPFGSVWEDKLKSLVNGGKLPLTQIAKQLNVDPKTVDKYSESLGLNLYWKSPSCCRETVEESLKPVTVKVEQETSKVKYRKKWIMMRNNYPEKTKAEIRQLCKAAYTWLYKNDRA